MQLRGSPDTEMYWNRQMTPSALLGIRPGSSTSRQAAGAALPPTSAAGGDGAFVPWSPDSPVFWGVVFIGLTVFGLAGASVRVRAFHRHASVALGDS